MGYQVPTNVAYVVRKERKRKELMGRLAEEEATGCSLQKIVDSLHHVGCRALPQRLCYLAKGTERHPQVLSRDECPIYREVVKELESYSTE